jgi:hypothetical protein
VGALALPVLGLGAMLGAGLWTESFLFWMFFPMALLGLLLGPALADRHLRRLLRGHAASLTVTNRRRGDVVKLRGRVRPGPTFESAGMRRSSVLACYAGTVDYITGRLSDGLERPWWETRGIDFVLDLPGNESVVVRVREAHLVQQPEELRALFWSHSRNGLPSPLRRQARPVRRGTVTETIIGETNVGPGDDIEVLGIVDREVSPAAEASARGERLQPVLRAGPLTPLVVRRCDEG